MIFHECNSAPLFSLVTNLRAKFVLEKLNTNITDPDTINSLYHPGLSVPLNLFSFKLYEEIPKPTDITAVDCKKHLFALEQFFSNPSSNSNSSELKPLTSLRSRIETEVSHINSFAVRVKDALSHLKNYAPNNWKRINFLIKEIIPLSTKNRIISKSKIGRGSSAIYYCGGIFIDPPENVDEDEELIQLLMNIVHEAGHQAMYILQSTDNLALDANQTVYSPIRKTDRPILKSIHAIAAISGMILLCEELLDKDLWSVKSKDIVHRHYKELKANLLLGLSGLKDKELTEIGQMTCRYWYAMAMRSA